jgi:hypothetical protein
VPEAPLQDNVLVPEFPSVMLVGDRMHVRPVLGETLALSATVPVKPRTLVTTTVDVPATPSLAATLGGLELIVKSSTVIVMGVE